MNNPDVFLLSSCEFFRFIEKMIIQDKNASKYFKLLYYQIEFYSIYSHAIECVWIKLTPSQQLFVTLINSHVIQIP